MWPDRFNIEVSRETGDKLNIYHALLLKWQKAINLVSSKTLDEAWIRHFVDSAQVERYVPHDVSRESQVLVDLGCGAGFPGLVLSMMRPDFEVHLVESDDRKCQFLRTVSRETKLNESNVRIAVHNERIEYVIDVINPDIVTARALADLSTLLGLVLPWAEANPNLVCLFMKGASVGAEIEAARQGFNFELEQFSSLTDPQASILRLKKITMKKSA